MSYLSTADKTSLDHPLSVNETTQIHSPPKKKLRLSLKGQKQILLGANCSLPKAFPETKTEKFPLKMQNIRPNLLDPMSLHVSYSGSGMGLVTPSYGRMENGDGEYERERDNRPLRLEPSTNDKSSLPPVATLLNLGNTCFLNSVLYTLRFTPGFAHLLHHLAADLTEKKLLSLGGNERRIGVFLSSGSPGLRTKSLTSLSPYNHEEHSIDPTKRKTLVLTERLHELLQTLHNAEQKGDLSEPFQGDAFLQALREVNPLFQGNQQQDAHELLVCLLDYLRDACQLVDKAQLKPVGETLNSASLDQSNGENSIIKKDKQSADKKKKNKKMFAEKEGKKGKRVIANNAPVINDALNDQPPSVVVEEINQTPDPTSGVKGDFISESFEGVTVLRTTCLECEYVTERKECFMDICVPIISDSPPGEEPPLSPSAFFASTLMEVDFLRDTNKYWCEQCVRYNEARRSVHYEKLPRLLILQLKRFSLSFGSTVHTSKVNDYMPTPMQLDCFCEHCQDSDLPLHSYRLYAIIMHLGATMASGHYVAYTRVCPSSSDYAACSRGLTSSSVHSSNNNSSRPNSERNSGSNSNSSGGILRFFKPKSSSALGTESPNAGTNIAPVTLCRSVNCCSARPRKLFPDPCDKEKENSGRESPSSSSSNSSANNLAEDIWLECDDEVIRVLRMRELEDLLCKKPRTSALTPYLLFYVQVNPTATTVK